MRFTAMLPRRPGFAMLLLLAMGCHRAAPTAPAPAPTPAPKPGPRVGGDYGPVTVEQLVGEHVCLGTGKSADEEFIWVIEPNRFTMRAGGDMLPAAVSAAVLGAERKAKEIEGAWTLDGRDLKLSDLKADGDEVVNAPTLQPFRTPVLRIHFGTEQYRLAKRTKLEK